MTMLAVQRQVDAMGSELFEVGVLRPGLGMLLREWTPPAVLAAVPWLQHENACRADIYIRPSRDRGSALVLVDDLSRKEVERLPALGLTPCVVVETSRENFQVWIRLGTDAQPPAIRTAVARRLAEMLGADMNSADFAHFGRLAGFTNRKPARAINGLPPFVRVIATDAGCIAPAGSDLVREALQSIGRKTVSDVANEVREPRTVTRSSAVGAAVSAASGHGASEQYLSLLRDLAKRYPILDASRADWMCALALFERGYGLKEIARAMRQHSPGLVARKDNLDDYVRRTVGKAEIWHELRKRGLSYDVAREDLLSLASQRSDQRRAVGTS
jgi:hypothetical protein